MLLSTLVLPKLPADKLPKVADFACGTGALLNGVYQRILSLYEQQGGNGKDIHQEMLENNIGGADIMPNATHLTAATLASSQLLVEYQRIVKAGNLPIHKRIDTMFSLDRTDGKNIITNRDEEGLDLLPNKNSQLYPVSVEKSWALFINLLLRYMVQVPTEPVNMVAYSGGSLRDYRA